MKDLLLLLCRYPFEEKNRETLSKLVREVRDWDETVKLINAHGIIALAAYNIKEAGLEKDLPPAAMSVLENAYLRNIARNSWMTERWKEVNSVLNKGGIRHILLKGLALEHSLYGSRGLRQMNDTDILISREDSKKAWYLLQDNGFRAEPLKSPLFRKIMFDLGQHFPALYKNGYAIEIHESLFDATTDSRLSNKDPFSDHDEIMIGGTQSLILSKELQTAYLVSHFNHHAFSGDCQLRLYTDILLLDKSKAPEFPGMFLTDPLQGTKKQFRKTAYKARISAIKPQHRLRFILGDTFPALKWIEERYKCNWLKALLMYPLRIGKLRWLF